MEDGEDEEDVDGIVEDGIHNQMEGEDYYSYVSLFSKYLSNLEESIAGSIGAHTYTTQCYSIYTSNFSNSGQFLTSCNKVEKYLTYLNSKSLGTDIYPRCKHLNYLLNTDDNYCKISNYDKTQLIDAYKQLMRNVHHLCASYVAIIDEVILGKIKDIQNMNEYLDKIKAQKTSCDNECCSNAKECIKIYDGYIDACYNDSTDDLCKALQIFKDDYEGHMANINCEENIKILTPPKERNSGVTVFIPFFMILVISIFSFILYKFTPFGSWLDIEIQKKKKILKNLYKNHKLSGIHKNEELNSHNNTFDIQYQSLRNS
ncbi:PIR Superfamily Protein [Plasmodium ovale wallikeri]|uniref:PIR Superfamily Protein n=1 Tax=Plasmodium ovale wallikeri TaxID=864142 RepID=A0A1A9AG51_PLAOA|nr:PIR Superfamily Protein [Plasmodium ovale wallikeri]SBT56312.1 PIR Superfamily Protein [Plasmodium ovale wallikeri]